MKSKAYQFKELVVLLLISVGFSCNHIQKHNLNTRKIQLIDSLGEITITLPTDFDTFHQWKRKIDYGCGAKMYYRFQPSTISMKEESGWFSDRPDTLFCLTIKHDFYRKCDEYDKDLNLKSIKEDIMLKRMDENRSHPFNFIINEKINNFDYLIYATTDSFFVGQTTQKFTAITFLNKTPITFEFYNNIDTFQTKRFIEMCQESIKTVKINKF